MLKHFSVCVCMYKKITRRIERTSKIGYFFFSPKSPAEKFSSPCFWLMMVACSHFVISSVPSVVIFIMIFWFLTEILAAVFKLVFCSIEFHPVSIISVPFLSVWYLPPPLCLRVMVPLHVISTF